MKSVTMTKNDENRDNDQKVMKNNENYQTQ